MKNWKGNKWSKILFWILILWFAYDLGNAIAEVAIGSWGWAIMWLFAASLMLVAICNLYWLNHHD